MGSSLMNKNKVSSKGKKPPKSGNPTNGHEINKLLKSDVTDRENCTKNWWIWRLKESLLGFF